MEYRSYKISLFGRHIFKSCNSRHCRIYFSNAHRVTAKNTYSHSCFKKKRGIIWHQNIQLINTIKSSA
nr:MAG TPA: hypothetical protein [Caudoviricetes sp.]DAZ50830.1 MAG TPA: hypothetical protein [Caudoviricetes sp.]